jgi:hypothetical protein
MIVTHFSHGWMSAVLFVMVAAVATVLLLLILELGLSHRQKRMLLAHTDVPVLKALRIAVSTLSLAACVLVAGLWLRSYTVMDVWNSIGPHTVTTSNGTILIDEGFERTDGIATYQVDASSSFGTWPRDIKPAGTGWSIRYWQLGCFALALGIVPWLPWSRRFGLRTLLIATTLVAVGLGIIIAAR